MPPFDAFTAAGKVVPVPKSRDLSRKAREKRRTNEKSLMTFSRFNLFRAKAE